MADKALHLTVSSQTFSEIAMRMEQKGINIGQGDIKAMTAITLEKGSELEQPHDWPLVKLRKDCAELITKLFEFYPDGTSVPVAIEELYQYILEHTLPEPTPTKPAEGEWK